MSELVAFQSIRLVELHPHPDKSADGLLYASGFALTRRKVHGVEQSSVIDILPMPTVV